MIYLFINYKRNRCPTTNATEERLHETEERHQRARGCQHSHQQGAEPEFHHANEGRQSTRNVRAPPLAEWSVTPAPAKNFLLTRLHKK